MPHPVLPRPRPKAVPRLLRVALAAPSRLLPPQAAGSKAPKKQKKPTLLGVGFFYGLRAGLELKGRRSNKLVDAVVCFEVDSSEA